MSTTITLEEALKRATTGPLEADNFATIWGVPKNGGEDGHVANCSHGAIDPEYRAKESEKLDAALLAHCYNQLPDLVSRLEALQKWAEQMGGFSSPQWADLPELIERANKVQLP